MRADSQVVFCGGRIEIYPRWIVFGDHEPYLWDTDELIDKADVIEGLRFARLDDVIRYKRDRNRHKDRVHNRAIEAHLPYCTCADNPEPTRRQFPLGPQAGRRAGTSLQLVERAIT
jgi:hypothetical protein